MVKVVDVRFVREGLKTTNIMTGAPCLERQVNATAIVKQT